MPTLEEATCRQETEKHIDRVQECVHQFADALVKQTAAHDASKLQDPEFPAFVEFTPKLKTSTYNSPEYKEFLAAMKPALDHHYQNNTHHPEHFHDGIMGMTLMDLVEMYCDWKAAGERHANGSLENSIKANHKRFELPPELVRIFDNTRVKLGWK